MYDMLVRDYVIIIKSYTFLPNYYLVIRGVKERIHTLPVPKASGNTILPSGMNFILSGLGVVSTLTNKERFSIPI